MANVIKEIWKDIESIPGYKISNQGRIKSHTGKVLKTFHNSRGYVTIRISNYGNPKSITLHRIVAKAFVPNPNNLPEVNHIDSNRANNNFNNLEWCTHSQNQFHAYKSGFRDHKGDNHPQRKINSDIVKEIRSRYIPYVCTGKKLAAEYGITVSSLNNIISGKNWKHVN